MVAEASDENQRAVTVTKAFAYIIALPTHTCLNNY